MSSAKSDEIAEVEQLHFESEGRGFKKRKPVKRTIRDEHGTPLVSFPKRFLDFGMKLNQEVIIEKRGSNPLNWEIVIKPALKPLKGIEDRQRNEEADYNPKPNNHNIRQG